MQDEVPQKPSQPKRHWKDLSSLYSHCSSDFFLGCLVSLSQWKTNPAERIEKKHSRVSFRFSEPSGHGWDWWWLKLRAESREWMLVFWQVVRDAHPLMKPESLGLHVITWKERSTSVTLAWYMSTLNMVCPQLYKSCSKRKFLFLNVNKNYKRTYPNIWRTALWY